jgi:hypothetical protein
MSDDYISGLRRDLVEAAARQQQAGRAAHVVRPLRPRAWSPLAVLGAAAAVAALFLVVVTLRAVNPPREPSAPKIVGTVHLGGQPLDAVAVADSVVVADYAGDLVQIDAGDPDVRTLLDSMGTPVSLAADGNVLTVLSRVARAAHAPRFNLLKLDVHDGRLVASRRPFNSLVDVVGAGAGTGGMWLPTSALHPGDLGRIGLDRGRNPSRPAIGVDDVVVGERAVWARLGDAVVELDAGGRAVNRVDGLSPTLAFENRHALLPDADGAWVVGHAGGLLYRIEGGRVTRRVKVGRTAGVLARTGSTVWVSATSSAGHYELVRVDADDGRVTGRVPLGLNAPQAIVPVGKRLWVVTGGGDAIVVSPE